MSLDQFIQIGLGTLQDRWANRKTILSQELQAVPISLKQVLAKRVWRHAEGLTFLSNDVHGFGIKIEGDPIAFEKSKKTI